MGGIYTVIKTKAGTSVEELGDQYCLIGPYNEACVRMEVEVMEPYNEAMVGALRQMREHGIKVVSRHLYETAWSLRSCTVISGCRWCLVAGS